jgi:hypothetical protein
VELWGKTPFSFLDPSLESNGIRNILKLEQIKTFPQHSLTKTQVEKNYYTKVGCNHVLLTWFRNSWTDKPSWRIKIGSFFTRDLVLCNFFFNLLSELKVFHFPFHFKFSNFLCKLHPSWGRTVIFCFRSLSCSNFRIDWRLNQTTRSLSI